MRQHGTRSMYEAGCRCDPCRVASAAYERKSRRDRFYGRQDLIDATSSREHLRALSEQGMGTRQVAAQTGLSRKNLSELLSGKNTQARVRKATAAAILGVRLELADGMRVDPTGSRRRIEALMTLGYSRRRLAIQLEVNVQHFYIVLNRNKYVLAGLAHKISNLYDKLSLIPAEPLSDRDSAVTRTKLYAQRRKFVPPLAWDDDTIDDPAAEPQGIRPKPRRKPVARAYPNE